MIYFVQSPNGGPIKIGTTTRLVDRLVQLEFEVSRHLVVLGVMAGSIGNERKLHARFFHLASLSMPGTEWFEPDAELLRFIDDNTRAWHPDDDDEDLSLRPNSPKRDVARVTLEFSAEEHDLIKRRAARRRETLKQYMKRAIDELVERESKLGTILESDVWHICNSYNGVASLRDLAQQYGVEVEAIRKVLSGETHPHITRRPIHVSQFGAQRAARTTHQLPAQRRSEPDDESPTGEDRSHPVVHRGDGHPRVLREILRDQAQAHEKAQEGA